MAQEPNIPRHPYYQRRNHIKMPRIGQSRQWIDPELAGTGGPVEDSIPVITSIPDITGSPYVGSTLVAVPSPTFGWPRPTRTWQWTNLSTPIPGETGQSLLLTAGLLGATISVRQTETNPLGEDTAYSNYVGPITQPLTAPIITGVPTIAGTPQVTQILTATPAPVTGNPTPTRTWHWFADGILIPSAVTAQHTVTIADLGKNITVQQTETNSQGTAIALSAPTSVVTPLPPTENWAAVSATTGSPTILNYSDGDGTWRAYRFTASGSITFNLAGDIEYLVVGGGGGGGAATGGGGAGGGGGGMKTGKTAVTATTLAVTVGAGGLGRGVGANGTVNGFQGEGSSVASVSSVSGGGGGSGSNTTPTSSNGGCGGGARQSGAVGTAIADQGFAGGLGTALSIAACGGGGGAGATGGAASANFGGAGGSGRQSSITGVATYYAGGGGGGGGQASTTSPGGQGGGGNGQLHPVQAGTNGLGGGGGGAGGANPGGSGGSGVVIIRTKVTAIQWSNFNSIEELQEVVDHYIDHHSLVLPSNWSTMNLIERIEWLQAHT